MNARVALAAVTLAWLLLLGVACEDEDNATAPTVTSIETSTTGPVSPAPTTAGPVTAGPTAAGGPNEDGQPPVFWRTADGFTSVVEGAPYLVVFRIDVGFDEPSLTVTAVCTDCPDSDEQTFAGTNSQPVGEDAPGAYYPINLTFPHAGSWELTVLAGVDVVTIPVRVAAAP